VGLYFIITLRCTAQKTCICVGVCELAKFSDIKFMELKLQIYAHLVAKPLNISQMHNISLHCPNKNAEKSHTFPSSGKKRANLGKPKVIIIYHSSYRHLVGTK